MATSKKSGGLKVKIRLGGSNSPGMNKRSAYSFALKTPVSSKMMRCVRCRIEYQTQNEFEAHLLSHIYSDEIPILKLEVLSKREIRDWTKSRQRRRHRVSSWDTGTDETRIYSIDKARGGTRMRLRRVSDSNREALETANWEHNNSESLDSSLSSEAFESNFIDNATDVDNPTSETVQSASDTTVIDKVPVSNTEEITSIEEESVHQTVETVLSDTEAMQNVMDAILTAVETDQTAPEEKAIAAEGMATTALVPYNPSNEVLNANTSSFSIVPSGNVNRIPDYLTAVQPLVVKSVSVPSIQFSQNSANQMSGAVVQQNTVVQQHTTVLQQNMYIQQNWIHNAVNSVILPVATNSQMVMPVMQQQPHYNTSQIMQAPYPVLTSTLNQTVTQFQQPVATPQLGMQSAFQSSSNSVVSSQTFTAQMQRMEMEALSSATQSATVKANLPSGYKCTLCPTQCRTKVELDLHTMSHKGSHLTCNICGFVLNNYNAFREHRLIHQSTSNSTSGGCVQENAQKEARLLPAILRRPVMAAQVTQREVVQISDDSAVRRGSVLKKPENNLNEAVKATTSKTVTFRNLQGDLSPCVITPSTNAVKTVSLGPSITTVPISTNPKSLVIIPTSQKKTIYPQLLPAPATSQRVPVIQNVMSAGITPVTQAQSQGNPVHILPKPQTEARAANQAISQILKNQHLTVMPINSRPLTTSSSSNSFSSIPTSATSAPIVVTEATTVQRPPNVPTPLLRNKELTITALENLQPDVTCLGNFKRPEQGNSNISILPVPKPHPPINNSTNVVDNTYARRMLPMVNRGVPPLVPITQRSTNLANCLKTPTNSGNYQRLPNNLGNYQRVAINPGNYQKPPNNTGNNQQLSSNPSNYQKLPFNPGNYQKQAINPGSYPRQVRDNSSVFSKSALLPGNRQFPPYPITSQSTLTPVNRIPQNTQVIYSGAGMASGQQVRNQQNIQLQQQLPTPRQILTIQLPRMQNSIQQPGTTQQNRFNSPQQQQQQQQMARMQQLRQMQYTAQQHAQQQQQQRQAQQQQQQRQAQQQQQQRQAQQQQQQQRQALQQQQQRQAQQQQAQQQQAQQQQAYRIQSNYPPLAPRYPQQQQTVARPNLPPPYPLSRGRPRLCERAINVQPQPNQSSCRYLAPQSKDLYYAVTNSTTQSYPTASYQQATSRQWHQPQYSSANVAGNCMRPKESSILMPPPSQPPPRLNHKFPPGTSTHETNLSLPYMNTTRQTSVQDVESLTCGICSRDFANPAELSSHLVTHIKDRETDNISPDIIFCSPNAFSTMPNIKQERPSTPSETEFQDEENEFGFIISSVRTVSEDQLDLGEDMQSIMSIDNFATLDDDFVELLEVDEDEDIVKSILDDITDVIEVTHQLLDVDGVESDVSQVLEAILETTVTEEKSTIDELSGNSFLSEEFDDVLEIKADDAASVGSENDDNNSLVLSLDDEDFRNEDKMSVDEENPIDVEMDCEVKCLPGPEDVERCLSDVVNLSPMQSDLSDGPVTLSCHYCDCPFDKLSEALEHAKSHSLTPSDLNKEYQRLCSIYFSKLTKSERRNRQTKVALQTRNIAPKRKLSNTSDDVCLKMQKMSSKHVLATSAKQKYSYLSPALKITCINCGKKFGQYKIYLCHKKNCNHILPRESVDSPKSFPLSVTIPPSLRDSSMVIPVLDLQKAAIETLASCGVTTFIPLSCNGSNGGKCGLGIPVLQGSALVNTQVTNKLKEMGVVNVVPLDPVDFANSQKNKI